MRQGKTFGSHEIDPGGFRYVAAFNWSVTVSTFTCPICHEERIVQSWSEEYHGVVEQWETCGPCGYRRGFSYGQTQMVLEPLSLEYSYADTARYQVRQQKLFKRAVRHARRAFVRGYRFNIESGVTT